MVFYHRDQVVNNKEFHLASRGGHANKHPGNKASRQLIGQYAEMYVATKKNERGALARHLYETLFQDKRIFVVERDYFLRCIEDDRKTEQQGGPRDSSRRKLSNERVASVVGANGGSLASILALPPRVFLPTGEAFAFDTIDHLLRDEARKVRRRGSVAASAKSQPEQEEEQEQQEGEKGQHSLCDQNSPCSSQAPATGSGTHHCSPAAPRSCSVDSAVSVASEHHTSAKSTATPDQLPSSPSCHVKKTLTPSSCTSFAEPTSNASFWQSIHVRKNHSAMIMEAQLPDMSTAVAPGFGELDLHNPQDFNLWKAWSEHMTDNNNKEEAEDLLKPISSHVLESMWSNNNINNKQEEDGISNSSHDLFSSSEEDDDDDDELTSLIGASTICKNIIPHGGSIDFLDHFSVAMLFDEQEF